VTQMEGLWDHPGSWIWILLSEAERCSGIQGVDSLQMALPGLGSVRWSVTLSSIHSHSHPKTSRRKGTSLRTNPD
jgi:hypothetical protein